MMIFCILKYYELECALQEFLIEFFERINLDENTRRNRLEGRATTYY